MGHEKEHIFNPCALFFDSDSEGNEIQGMRKALVLEIFLIYVVYIFIVIRGINNGFYQPSKINKK